MENIGVALGILIRSERNKRNLTAEDLANLTGYSRSYISRIENGFSVDSIVYTKILSIFDLSYISLENCKDIYNEFKQMHKKIAYLNANQIEVQNFLDKYKEYKNSPLFAKYMIIKLINYVCFETDVTEERKYFLDEIENLSDLFSQRDKQIIYDYLGASYMYSNLEIAEKYFNIALSLGVFEDESSLLFYHLGIFYCMKNNQTLALFYSMKAHDCFSAKLNFKRLFYTQLHIANIFSTSKNYELANQMYTNLLESEVNESIYIIYSNLAWNLYKMNNFNEALKYELKNESENYVHYLHLIFIYVSLNDYKKVKESIRKCKQVCSSPFEINYIEILEVNLLNIQKPNNYIEQLTLTYELSRECADSETYKILNKIITYYYEKNRKYREANIILKKN